MSDNNMTIDELAGIIKNEFDNVRNEFDGVNNRLKKLEDGQEEIKMRLTNVAYRFEMQELEIKTKLLEQRVEKLEKR